MKLFTEALDVREIDSSDWFRFFFSWLVVIFVLLFKMPLSSGFVNELLAVSIGLYPLDFYFCLKWLKFVGGRGTIWGQENNCCP